MGFLGEYWGQRVVQNDNLKAEKLLNAKSDLKSFIEKNFKNKFTNDEINNLCDEFKSVKSIKKFQDDIASNAISYKIRNTENLKLSDLRKVYKSELFDEKYTVKYRGLTCEAVVTQFRELKEAQGEFMFDANLPKIGIISQNCTDLYEEFSKAFDLEIKKIKKEEEKKISFENINELKDFIIKKIPESLKNDERFNEKNIKSLSEKLISMSPEKLEKFIKILFCSTMVENFSKNKDFQITALLDFFKNNEKFFDKKYEVKSEAVSKAHNPVSSVVEKKKIYETNKVSDSFLSKLNEVLNVEKIKASKENTEKFNELKESLKKESRSQIIEKVGVDDDSINSKSNGLVSSCFSFGCHGKKEAKGL